MNDFKIEPVLSIENVSVDFDGFRALSNITTEIMPNSVHFFIGPNGAGKTTLLDIICGKTKPTEGTVVYHDGPYYRNRTLINIDLTKLYEFDIVNYGIGRKFQVPSVYKNLTVYENMELSLKGEKGVYESLFFKPTEQQIKDINSVLELIGLQDKENVFAGSLSHGQKQWLEIGMLIVQKTKILLLDEPVAGMGKEETEKTGNIIKEIAKKCAVVVVEHDMEFVRQVADRVTVMHEGKILVEGAAGEVLSNEKVKEVYLGRGKFHKSGEE